MLSKLPSVLSGQRGTIVTDGVMYSIIKDDDGQETFESIPVIRHGIRGITSKAGASDVFNIQRTESAKTNQCASGLAIKFNFRSISSKSLLFACADHVYRDHLDAFIDRFFAPGVPEFDEVCRRLARNILNGRWMWRNQVLGESSVIASVGDREYSGQGSSTKHFDNFTSDEIEFASTVIQSGLMGNSVAATVVGRIKFGFTGAVEVFPSQNMVTNKSKGFARSLYKIDMISRKTLLSILAKKDAEDSGDFVGDMIVMGTAALRDQKIGNAIRTIDTWYDMRNGLLDKPSDPIPIEPNGASLEKNVFYRDSKNDAKYALARVDEMRPNAGAFSHEAAYLIGLLIRGGVFSEGKSD